jgi:hypothetical protein
MILAYAFVSLVVKNPLSPTEHTGGVGVNNELFEESLEQFVVCDLLFGMLPLLLNAL